MTDYTRDEPHGPHRDVHPVAAAVRDALELIRSEGYTCADWEIQPGGHVTDEEVHDIVTARGVKCGRAEVTDILQKAARHNRVFSQTTDEPRYWLPRADEAPPAEQPSGRQIHRGRKS